MYKVPFSLAFFVLLLWLCRSNEIKLRKCTKNEPFTKAKCYEDIGYKIMHGRFNFTRLINYCRSPEISSRLGCFGRAAKSCTGNTNPKLIEANLKEAEFTDNAITDMCSNTEVIEQNLNCMAQNEATIQKCVREARVKKWEVLKEILKVSRAGFTYEDFKLIGSTYSWNIAQCYRNILQQHCGTEIGRLMSAFHVSVYLGFQ